MSVASLFPLQNPWLLVISLIGAITSIFLSYKDKDKAAILILTITAFSLRIFAAHLDPFLHRWDECFHALVAKNMTDHPFEPMLIAKPVLPYDYRVWSFNHIWLHKQPLFLWQMALSIKIFGTSAYAIRYPGVLMESLIILLTYRIGLLATKDKKISFIGALLTTFSYFSLELLSGHIGMDQNDVAFSFYVLASIWAYLEYEKKKTFYKVVLIGFFAGCAVLNKWLLGLLVFSAWGVNILLQIRKTGVRKEIFYFLAALLVAGIVSLPWQIYVYHAFPKEALYELGYNFKHLNNAVEGHAGDIWYYFDECSVYFGDYTWVLLPTGILLILWTRKKQNGSTKTLLFIFCTSFLFFTFIAGTKVHSYLAPVLPIGYIIMAIALYQIILKINRHLYVPFAALSAFILFNLANFTNNHNPNNAEWQILTSNENIYKNIDKYIPANTKIIFNTNSFENINLMFYHNDIVAYNWCISANEFEAIKERKLSIAVFEDHKGYVIPSYIKEYPLTYIIHKQLQEYP